MPTYNELFALSLPELIKRSALALNQLDKAEAQGENIAEKARIYHVYKNELAKRDYKQQTS
jgi:hypothetical protein